jgi:hypothetical protein
LFGVVVKHQSTTLSVQNFRPLYFSLVLLVKMSDDGYNGGGGDEFDYDGPRYVLLAPEMLNIEKHCP